MHSDKALAHNWNKQYDEDNVIALILRMWQGIIFMAIYIHAHIRVESVFKTTMSN